MINNAINNQKCNDECNCKNTNFTFECSISLFDAHICRCDWLANIFCYRFYWIFCQWFVGWWWMTRWIFLDYWCQIILGTIYIKKDKAMINASNDNFFFGYLKFRVITNLVETIIIEFWVFIKFCCCNIIITFDECCRGIERINCGNNMFISRNLKI